MLVQLDSFARRVTTTRVVPPDATHRGLAPSAGFDPHRSLQSRPPALEYHRRVRRVLVILGVLASGCNQVFGIEETRPIEPAGIDRDDDGTADEIDNCPDFANVDQIDSDRDDRGDACDGCNECLPCEFGPDHDEDGDHIPDGCDNCPTVGSSNVANADGDDLGDVCDEGAGMQRRVLFDGFGDLATTWAMVGAWTVSGDAAESVDGPHPLNYRLTHIGALIDGTTPWTLEIAFDVPVSPAERDSIGANLVDEQSNLQWGCTVLWQDGVWSLTNGIPQPIALASGRTTMTLSSLRAMSTDRLCEVPGNPEKASRAFLEGYPMSVELFASRSTRFSYVEVIE